MRSTRRFRPAKLAATMAVPRGALPRTGRRDLLRLAKVLSVPDGRGDIRGLLVATLAGAFGLAFIGVWVQDRERGD